MVASGQALGRGWRWITLSEGGAPDRDLVRDLASSDEARRREALGRLFDRHGQRVLNVAYRVLGDWSRAQDVVQDVFLHLQDRIGTWRGEAGLQSWLYRITVNRAIDHRRREARRPAWRMGDTPLEDPVRRPRGEEATPSPPDLLEREGERERVQRALEALSPKLRAALVLRYQEGQSYEELAEVLACSLGTVKSRLNRAHAAFKKAYEDLG